MAIISGNSLVFRNVVLEQTLHGLQNEFLFGGTANDTHTGSSADNDLPDEFGRRHRR